MVFVTVVIEVLVGVCAQFLNGEVTKVFNAVSNQSMRLLFAKNPSYQNFVFKFLSSGCLTPLCFKSQLKKANKERN